MSRRCAIALFLALAAAAGAGLLAWPAPGWTRSAAEPPPQAPAVEGTRGRPQIRSDIPYGGVALGVADRQRMLDLYIPDRSTGTPAGAAAPPPLFVYIHGGAWVSGDKRQYAELGEALAARGVLVAIINYRLSGVGATAVRHPSHAQDAATAVAWLRKRADELGFDKARIFIGGHSAGAHISALLAYDPSLLGAVGVQPDAIRGYIGLEGIYDLPELVRRFPSYRVDFLQVAFSGDETSWRAASPQHLPIQHRRPWLLLHSQHDELVDLEQSRRFKTALENKQVPVSWLQLARGSHFGVIDELSRPGSPLSDRVLDFIRTAR